jgi:hypothetical protein
MRGRPATGTTGRRDDLAPRRPLLFSPLGLAPVVMSMFCIGMILLHVARFGTLKQEDEGTEVHLFQLLMVLQIPLILIFVGRWWPDRRRETLVILSLQAFLALLAFLLLYLFER